VSCGAPADTDFELSRGEKRESELTQAPVPHRDRRLPGKATLPPPASGATVLRRDFLVGAMSNSGASPNADEVLERWRRRALLLAGSDEI